jgi:hypothetical protein
LRASQLGKTSVSFKLQTSKEVAIVPIKVSVQELSTCINIKKGFFFYPEV